MVKQQADGRRSPQSEFETSTSKDGYVIGADIGGTNLRLALADTTGTILARWSTSTVGIRSATKVIDLICEGVNALLQGTSLPRSALIAIAAGAPGITDVDQGIVIATSYLMGWRDVPLRTLLEAALGLPASIDNDVNLAAIGEHYAGTAQGANDFVFIAIGTGVGAGIMLKGQLLRGAAWTAGEIGYMLVPGVSEASVERGQPGALESIIGGEGIRTQWQNRWNENATVLPREMSATQIFDHALKNDPLALEVLHLAARTLSYAIYNLSLILNCPLFVLGGSVGLHPALREATQKFLNQRSARVQPQVAQSTLGSEAQLIGAIHLAIQTAKTRHPIALS
jgi:glucokinase